MFVLPFMTSDSPFGIFKLFLTLVRNYIQMRNEMGNEFWHPMER